MRDMTSFRSETGTSLFSVTESWDLHCPSAGWRSVAPTNTFEPDVHSGLLENKVSNNNKLSHAEFVGVWMFVHSPITHWHQKGTNCHSFIVIVPWCKWIFMEQVLAVYEAIDKLSDFQRDIEFVYFNAKFHYFMKDYPGTSRMWAEVQCEKPSERLTLWG